MIATLQIRRIALALLFVGAPTFAYDSLEKMTSISNAYDSRSVFTNPAALGYQTELNGAPLLGSFTYAVNHNVDNEFSSSLALGNFGASVEHLGNPAGMFNRFGFGVGVPITPSWYVGARYRFTRADSVFVDKVNSWDLGIQWRPSQKVSFGLMGIQLNRPQVAGINWPARMVAGVTVRPVEKLELSADVETNSDNFAKQFSYQVTAGVELARGFQATVAYQRDQKFLFGLQLNLDRASIYSVGQPAIDRQSITAGAQFSTKPYRTLLRPDSVLKMNVDGSLQESGTKGGLFRAERPTLLGLLEQLDRAGNDPSLKLVAIKLENFPLGMAAAQEVHEAILRLKEQGKRVDVFLSNSGMKEYIIASIATKILMEPTAELKFAGLRSERYYIKGTLDKIGIEGQFLAKGKYKSAPEMFTRREASEPSREETLQQLGEAERIIFETLAKSRNITKARWDALLNTALLDAEEAKSSGLVDVIGHMDAILKAEALSPRETLDVSSKRLALPKRIAVIVASGDILQKRIQLLSLAGESQVTPDKMKAHFREALSDPRTEAIVFRVSSPGGEVTASDEIASLVEAAEKKGVPVVISMGDVAASGGYMISAPGRKIFAQPLTITGSIGVFLGKFNLGELYKKIDLRKEIITHAPFAGLLTEDRAWTKEEREILWRRLSQYYEGFIKYVSKARKLSVAHVDEVAQGRVWLGSQAIKEKLVDELGGYHEAIEYAANEVSLKPGDYETWMIEDSRGLFEFFSPDDVLGKDPLSSFASSVFSPSLVDEVKWVSRMKETPFLYLSPVRGLY